MNIIETNLSWNGTLSVRPYTNYIALHHAEASKCSVYDVHAWHKSNGWSGIGYHFFVRKNGEVYRGRPIDKIGAHVQGKNSESIGICAEGSYMKETMPEVQKKAICELLVYLKNNFYPNAKIVGHGEIGSSNCPGDYYPLEEIKSHFREIAGAVSEYTDINDIIWELRERKILTDSDLWVKYCKKDSNIYWFCRKLCQYVRTKQRGETADSVYDDVHDIIWDLHYRGIISDEELWTEYCKKDANVYHLLRKALHWCRTY